MVKTKEMSVEEQYADIYTEAEEYTPIKETIRNTELTYAREEGLAQGIKESLK